MAFEGLNNLGHSGRDCIIILNDNGRSYAPTVSRLGESLVKIRNNPVYMRRQAKLEKILLTFLSSATLPRQASTQQKLRFAKHSNQRSLRSTRVFAIPVPSMTGSTLRFLKKHCARRSDARGPTGHSRAHTEGSWVRARRKTTPSSACMTPPRPNLAASPLHSPKHWSREGEARPELVALPQCRTQPAFSCSPNDSLVRMFDVGIAEQHAVTAAAGMAMGGLRPVVAVYSTFSRPSRSGQPRCRPARSTRCVLPLTAGITGDDGPSHHGILDMVLLTKVLNMTVFAPSSQEIGQMLHDALDITDGPVAIRWAKTAASASASRRGWPRLNARRIATGHSCASSAGKMLDAAEIAAEQLEAQGSSVTVWDARVVKPLTRDDRRRGSPPLRDYRRGRPPRRRRRDDGF